MDLEQLRQMMQNGTLGKLAGEESKPLPAEKPNAGPSGVIKEARLYFREGKSDKVYNIQLVADLNNGCHRVMAQYGRRGKALKGVNKGVFNSVLDARAAFDKVVLEKTKKGYKHR